MEDIKNDEFYNHILDLRHKAKRNGKLRSAIPGETVKKAVQKKRFLLPKDDKYLELMTEKFIQSMFPIEETSRKLEELEAKRKMMAKYKYIMPKF
ncbi:hypothetical protein HDV01_002159 [Terramyces sp. JEL0728]|nr:hypothetical protein HDV01_002159 [Terramyces sp. JEL0728]